MSKESVMNAFAGSDSGGGSTSITIPDYDGVEARVDYTKPGAYPGELIEVSDKPTSTGKAQLSFVFKLDLGGGRTMRIWLNHVLTQAAMFRFVRTAGVLELPSKQEIDIPSIIGKRCMVNVIDNDYDPTKKKSKADSIDPMPGQANGAFQAGSDGDDELQF